jgi:hypothetical protein
MRPFGNVDIQGATVLQRRNNSASHEAVSVSFPTQETRELPEFGLLPRVALGMQKDSSIPASASSAALVRRKPHSFSITRIDFSRAASKCTN